MGVTSAFPFACCARHHDIVSLVRSSVIELDPGPQYTIAFTLSKNLTTCFLKISLRSYRRSIKFRCPDKSSESLATSCQTLLHSFYDTRISAKISTESQT